MRTWAIFIKDVNKNQIFLKNMYFFGKTSPRPMGSRSETSKRTRTYEFFTPADELKENKIK